MKGRHLVKVVSRKAEYCLALERKISVIKGKSGSGKTSVIRLIANFLELGKDSGIKVSVSTSANLMVLFNSSKWEQELSNLHNTILFIDEDVRFLYEVSFQRTLWKSDCYAVIVSRSGMFTALPFAISSVYQFATKKNGSTTITYLYKYYEKKYKTYDFDMVLTEDSNSGFEMAKFAFNPETVVLSASGNSNILPTLFNQAKKYSHICIIVDGAAFGGFIEGVLKFSEIKLNTVISAPESFEYILLKSDFFKKYINEELIKTYDYCDCLEYITWERFYEDLIEKLTSQNFGFTYSKHTLNSFFMTKNCAKYFLKEISNYFVEKAKNEFAKVD